MKSKFRKDKHIVVTSAGFDEYYLLKSESMDTEVGELDIEGEEVSTKKMVTAFSKYTGGRVSNRVVLNRFIGMIS